MARGLGGNFPSWLAVPQLPAEKLLDFSLCSTWVPATLDSRVLNLLGQWSVTMAISMLLRGDRKGCERSLYYALNRAGWVHRKSWIIRSCPTRLESAQSGLSPSAMAPCVELNRHHVLFWHLLCIFFFCFGNKKLAIIFWSLIKRKLFKSTNIMESRCEMHAYLTRVLPTIIVETLMGLRVLPTLSWVVFFGPSSTSVFRLSTEDQGGHPCTAFMCTKSPELGPTSICSYLQLWNYKHLHCYGKRASFLHV